MITYPSTHGVFEAAIRDICAVVHDARRPGLSGRRQPERAGRHLPAGRARRRRRPSQPAQDLLHPAWRRRPGHGADRGQARTWRPSCRATPWSPGVNPAGGRTATIGQVSAAPWGSPSILPISWAYIAMMGGPGLTRATQVAILNANYVARRLAPHYPIVYSGKNGMVAHECIVDLRPLKQATRRHRRGRRQAADRLRLPRADHVLAGARDPDDRADRERGQARARPVLRRDDRDPRGDPGDRAGRGRRRGQPAASNAPHTRGPAGRRLAAPLRPGGGLLPGSRRCARPSTGRRSAGSTTSTATATWSAPARRSRPIRTRGRSRGGAPRQSQRPEQTPTAERAGLARPIPRRDDGVGPARPPRLKRYFQARPDQHRGIAPSGTVCVARGAPADLDAAIEGAKDEPAIGHRPDRTRPRAWPRWRRQADFGASAVTVMRSSKRTELTGPVRDRRARHEALGDRRLDASGIPAPRPRSGTPAARARRRRATAPRPARAAPPARRPAPRRRSAAAAPRAPSSRCWR